MEHCATFSASENVRSGPPKVHLGDGLTQGETILMYELLFQ
jgi:hypothetical protein